MLLIMRSSPASYTYKLYLILNVATGNFYFRTSDLEYEIMA